MKKWLLTLWTGIQAHRLEREQHCKLAEHDRKEQEATAIFMLGLGDRMRRDNLPTRCEAVYETILKWANDDTDKIKQAALYLFLWELEQKRHSIAWEVSDIVLEIETLHRSYV